MKNYYQVLEIPNGSDFEVVKAAYRKLSAKYHPDNYVNETEQIQRKSSERQQEINEAYQFLSDSVQKEQYDNAILKSNIHSQFNSDLNLQMLQEINQLKLQKQRLQDNIESKRRNLIISKYLWEEKQLKQRVHVIEMSIRMDRLQNKKQILDVQLKEAQEKLFEFYQKIDLELSIDPEIIEISSLLQEVDEQLKIFQHSGKTL